MSTLYDQSFDKQASMILLTGLYFVHHIKHAIELRRASLFHRPHHHVAEHDCVLNASGIKL
jgi:hypothetical protein